MATYTKGRAWWEPRALFRGLAPAVRALHFTRAMSDADVGDLTSVPEPIEPECTRIMRRLTSEDPKPIPARDGEPWAKGSTEIAIPCGHMASIAHEKTAPAPRRKAHAKRARSRRSVDKR